MKAIFRILQELGYPVNQELQSYYSAIDLWKMWWKGYVPDFHRYSIKADGAQTRTLKRKQMRMAKKVCEDWADLLLNDKTRILVSGSDDNDSLAKSTQAFITGDEIEQSGGVFGSSKFWKAGNKAVEREFAQGTVCFYIQLDKPKVSSGKLTADGLRIKVIKDAQMIVPLTYDEEEISEIALASMHIVKGQEIMYVQIFHKDLGDGYEVQNYWYQVNNEQVTRVAAPNGEADSYKLPCKPFVILRPNLENNIADVPMGMSVYANALDNLQSCDLAFDNLYADTLLGKKKVFMNQAAVSLRPTAFAVDDDGNARAVNMEPDINETLEKSLYITTGEKLIGDQQFFQEYNPDLRIDANKDNIQFNLNLLSSKVGLGQRRYSFDSNNMATATEVKVSNKDLTESVWKQRIAIYEVLTDLTRAVLIIGKEKCGAKVDPDAKITIQFDDTMFNDEEAERMRMLQEISQGVVQKWEYRVKYYGEDEETARKVTGESGGIEPDPMEDYFKDKKKPGGLN